MQSLEINPNNYLSLYNYALLLEENLNNHLKAEQYYLKVI